MDIRLFLKSSIAAIAAIADASVMSILGANQVDYIIAKCYNGYIWSFYE